MNTTDTATDTATDTQSGDDDAGAEHPAQRIEAQRVQIIRVMSIIEACRMGSDSMLAPLGDSDEPDFEGALAAAHDLLDDVAGELETVARVFAPRDAD